MRFIFKKYNYLLIYSIKKAFILYKRFFRNYNYDWLFYFDFTIFSNISVVIDFGRSNEYPKALSHMIFDKTPKDLPIANRTV